MAYEFRADETVEGSVSRCGREQVDRALHALEEEIHSDPVEAIHAARKAIKRGRALLRLVRGGLPGRRRQRDNAQLRDAARQLSALRDGAVMLQTVDKLAERFVGQLPQATFAALREAMAQPRRADASAAPELEQARRDLRELRERIDGWQVKAEGWDALSAGLLRTYRNGRRGLDRARGRPSPEELHEWRKRVKDLWYHLRLLGAVGGPTVRGQAEEAERLADLLGDEHDLVTLREALLISGAQIAADVDEVIALIDHRREQLRDQAARVGARLYAEQPRAFERRLARSWDAGRQIHALTT